MLDEVDWLEASGHEVAHFSTRHPENDPSPWAGYFAPYLEIGPQTALTPSEKAIAVKRMFWNTPAARRFASLLRDFRPDIVHVHGIHRQISPSILVEARRAGVPVVQTLHDYHPICASGDLLLAAGEPATLRIAANSTPSHALSTPAYTRAGPRARSEAPNCSGVAGSFATSGWSAHSSHRARTWPDSSQPVAFVIDRSTYCRMRFPPRPALPLNRQERRSCMRVACRARRVFTRSCEPLGPPG